MNQRIFILLHICTLSLISCTYSLAQTTKVQDNNNREIGLRFSGFDDFNFLYKKQKAQNHYTRHRFLFGELAYNSNNKDFGFNIGYAFGQEKSQKITNKLYYYAGLEYSLVLDYSNAENNQSRVYLLRIVPAIGFINGFRLEFNENLNLCLEIIPTLSAAFNTRGEGLENFNINGRLNTNATSLALMYRFSPD